MSSLIVPPEMKKHINPYSGYLDSTSPYHQCTLKALFRSTCNVRYLSQELISLLSCRKYISDNLGSDDLDSSVNQSLHPKSFGITAFNNKSGGIKDKYITLLLSELSRSASTLNEIVPLMVEDHILPYPEDLAIANPIMQLHQTNLAFLLQTSKNIINSPASLCPNISKINVDSGTIDFGEADFDASSYNDGTWHPEHLFTNTSHNRNNAYWTPLEVNFDSSPGGRGPGHRYTSNVYHGSRNSNKLSRANEQFPRWQYSVNDRPYERSRVYSSETMNGDNDRRTQENHGFDMTALIKKSIY